MKNNATRTIRSEEITIDVRICAALAANRGGEVYLAAIAPDMELTVITLDEAPGILPCFEEDDACLNLPDTSLLLCYNPAQVLKMGGKHYLTGPVILVRTNMDGEVISLTIDEVYLFQKYLASHSITLMADDQKLPCICIRGLERYAKKYGIDYAIRKDTSEVPPRYLVFFKAPDAEAFHSAFKEYSASLLNKDKRPSVLAKLHELMQAAAELPGKVRHKEQERGL